MIFVQIQNKAGTWFLPFETNDDLTTAVNKVWFGMAMPPHKLSPMNLSSLDGYRKYIFPVTFLENSVLSFERIADDDLARISITEFTPN